MWRWGSYWTWEFSNVMLVFGGVRVTHQWSAQQVHGKREEKQIPNLLVEWAMALLWSEYSGFLLPIFGALAWNPGLWRHLFSCHVLNRTLDLYCQICTYIHAYVHLFLSMRIDYMNYMNIIYLYFMCGLHVPGPPSSRSQSQRIVES